MTGNSKERNPSLETYIGRFILAILTAGVIWMCSELSTISKAIVKIQAGMEYDKRTLHDHELRIRDLEKEKN